MTKPLYRVTKDGYITQVDAEADDGAEYFGNFGTAIAVAKWKAEVNANWLVAPLRAAEERLRQAKWHLARLDKITPETLQRGNDNHEAWESTMNAKGG